MLRLARGLPNMAVALVPDFVSRRAVYRYDLDTVIIFGRGAPDRRHEACRSRPGHFEQRLFRRYTDGADFASTDVAATAQQRKYPARLCILTASQIEPKPGAAFKAFTLGARRRCGFGAE